MKKTILACALLLLPSMGRATSSIESIENLIIFAQHEKTALEQEWLSVEQTLVTDLERIGTSYYTREKLIAKAQEKQGALEDEIEQIEQVIQELEKKKKRLLNPELEPEPEPVIVEQEEEIIEPNIITETEQTPAISQETSQAMAWVDPHSRPTGPRKKVLKPTNEKQNENLRAKLPQKPSSHNMHQKREQEKTPEPTIKKRRPGQGEPKGPTNVIKR